MSIEQLENKILEIIEASSEMSYSDVQGVVGALMIKLKSDGIVNS